MATSVKYPTANDAGFTNADDAHADDGVYATAAPAQNATVLGYWHAFDLAIPAGAGIVGQISIEIQWKLSTTASIHTLGIQAYLGATAMGTEDTTTTEPTVDTVRTKSTLNGGWFVGWLNDNTNSGFRVRIRSTRGNDANAVTCSIDYIKVTVTYNAPPLAQTETETPPVDAVGIAELWYPNPVSIVDNNLWANGTAELVEIIALGAAIGTTLLMTYVDITKAFLRDASVGYTDYTTQANEATADDVPLLPASIGANDAFYYLAGFYGDTTIYGLYIDVTTAGQGTYTLAWEYYNGSAWVSLDDYIITFGSGINYKTAGINKIDISKPSDIADVDLNGILAKFIRARYVSGTVTTQPLAKQIFVYEVADYEVSSETFDETNKLQVLLAVQSKTDAQVLSELTKSQVILVVQAKLESLTQGESKEQIILVVQTELDVGTNDEIKEQVILVVQSKTESQVYSEIQPQVILVVQSLFDQIMLGELNREQVILVVQTKTDGQIETENKEQVIIVVPTETDIMNHLDTNNVQVILVVQTEADFFARKIPFVMNVPHLKFVMKRP